MESIRSYNIITEIDNNRRSCQLDNITNIEDERAGTDATDPDENFRGGINVEVYTSNAENPLALIAQIGAHYNSMPLEALNKLSRVCKTTHDIVQWRIDERKTLRDKYAPIFSVKLEKYLRKKMINHPINYTGQVVKSTPVSNFGYDYYGLRILDIGAPLFSEEYTAAVRIAFTNICLLARVPASFVAVLFINSYALLTVEIDSNDYIDRGDLTEAQLRNYANRGNLIDLPGRYFIDLNLDTKLNPILLGNPIFDPRALRLCISKSYSVFNTFGEQYTDIYSDPVMVAENFTHAIMHFNTVDENAYNWGDYTLIFDSKLDVNEHARKLSFLHNIALAETYYDIGTDDSSPPG